MFQFEVLKKMYFALSTFNEHVERKIKTYIGSYQQPKNKAFDTVRPNIFKEGHLLRAHPTLAVLCHIIYKKPPLI